MSANIQLNNILNTGVINEIDKPPEKPKLNCNKPKSFKIKILLTVTITALILVFFVFLIINVFILSKDIVTLKNDNKSLVKGIYDYEKKINKLLNISDLDFMEEIKVKLYDDLSRTNGRTISYIDTLYLTNGMRFGNSLISLNNVIYFYGIVGCKKIIVDPENWYISEPVYYKEKNIRIIPHKELKSDNSSEGVVRGNSNIIIDINISSQN